MSIINKNISIWASGKKLRGFTIVELLIVIVVVAILAAITVVSYNGVQGRTRATVVKSDLSNAIDKLEIDRSENGAYPSSASGLIASPGTTYTYRYSAGSDTYCLEAKNASSPGSTFFVNSNDGTIKDGSCPPPPSPSATVSKGSSAGGSMVYVVLNVQNFTASSYTVQCRLNGNVFYTTPSPITLPASGPTQLICSAAPGAGSMSVSISGVMTTASVAW